MDLELEKILGSEAVSTDKWNANWDKIGDWAGEFADYIIETGKSGQWTYAKYKSGRAECWGSFILTATKITPFAGMYMHSYPTQTLPISFKGTPLAFTSGSIGTGFVLTGRAMTSANTIQPIHVGSQDSPTGRVEILVKGEYA